ncbi:NAD(P)-dependent oxidoreductase [Clostridium sp.]|uniref:NAD(P)-dependent oxidoreductase n=1 Tax=Clostridium sp. TaxID=1506 RepID=UPI003464E5C9
MEKILITGGNGFLANRLEESLKDRYEIYSFSRLDLDVTNEKKVLNIFKEIKPNYVIHTAAIADTGKCENNKELSFNINVNGTINISKAAKNENCKVIFLSSEQVYNGNEEVGPYSENIIPSPNTEYGRQKLQGEEEVFKYNKDSVVLRLTWLFGMPERNKKVNSNILFNAINALTRREKITICSNEFRGMTYVYDIVDNFEKIMKLKGGIYNCGSENNMSSYEVASYIGESLNLNYDYKEMISEDKEKYKEKSRDLRISNKKLKDHGIDFSTTKEGIDKALKEWGLIS